MFTPLGKHRISSLAAHRNPACPDPWFVWIVRSPASTWGKHVSRNLQYLGESDSPVPLIASEFRQYLGQSIADVVLTAFRNCQYLGESDSAKGKQFRRVLNPASTWGKAFWAWF